jgi:threonine dehydratase
MAMTSGVPGPDDLAAARKVLGEVVAATPLLHSRVLSDLAGGPVYLKCENLQRTGSFKIRGAYLRIARLSGQDRARGVVAASAGNHAQGVALAAWMLGTKATVVMPEGAPLPKVEATRGYGADVILYGATVDQALIRATELAADPAVRVIGVQADAVAAFPASMAAGRPVTVECRATMADGIAVATPGDLALTVLTARAARVVTVTEESLSRALLLCLERSKQVVEPAGAAGVAALLEHPRAFEPPVVAVLSGGNIDPLLLAKVLQHGLAAAGRYLAFRCRLPDRPGALATLLSEVASLGANVLDVVHERVTPGLHVAEVEVLLQVETRGPDHCDSLIGQLRQSGYTLLFG